MIEMNYTQQAHEDGADAGEKVKAYMNDLLELAESQGRPDDELDALTVSYLRAVEVFVEDCQDCCSIMLGFGLALARTEDERNAVENAHMWLGM